MSGRVVPGVSDRSTVGGGGAGRARLVLVCRPILEVFAGMGIHVDGRVLVRAAAPTRELCAELLHVRARRELGYYGADVLDLTPIVGAALFRNREFRQAWQALLEVEDVVDVGRVATEREPGGGS